jgi:hypothetical protein
MPENVEIGIHINAFSRSRVFPDKGNKAKMSFFIISPELYAWVILPLLIFFARICDVSMETIYISRGIKFLAPIIAFFEIVI